MQTVKLANSVEIPILGYGVYLVKPEECERCVRDAIDVGYRLIDTAQAYFNEDKVGDAVAHCGVPRDEIFITSKIWISNAGFEHAANSIDRSLLALRSDYIDLMLIHQPFGDCYGTWRAMEEAYRSGKIRAIGVSNFAPDRLADLAEFNEISPMVNQVETHVFNQQIKAREEMTRYGTKLMSWGPFAEGKNNMFHHPVLTGIAQAHARSVSQIILRWFIQREIIVIPKTTHQERMSENFHCFDFKLTSDELNRIAKLDGGKSIFMDHNDPNTVRALKQLRV